MPLCWRHSIKPTPPISHRGDTDRGEQAQPILSSLPSPFLAKIVDVSAQRFVRWETQRGCPYRCSFCQHREAGARLAQRKRALNIERLREEIALFVQAGVLDIAVLDPIFNSGPDYLSILHEFRSQNYRGRLSLQCRFELVDTKFLDACAALNVRLEFGLQTIHEAEGRAIRRINKMDRVEPVLAELNRRGMAYEVSLIFGLPKQTLGTFLKTVDYCLRHHVPTIRAFPLMLLRGTELQTQKQEFGLIENQEVIPAVVASDTFSEQDWHAMNEIAAALEHTLGRHPANISALQTIIDSCPVLPPRIYSPARDNRRDLETSSPTYAQPL